MAKKVMICDDDQGILEMLEMMLEEYGYSVATESNSIQLLNNLRKDKPDLLLLDIWMPVLSGDQILKQLKCDPELNSLPVIMYSASSEGEQIAKNSGADAYIDKPFDLDDLINKIKSFI